MTNDSSVIDIDGTRAGEHPWRDDPSPTGGRLGRLRGGEVPRRRSRRPREGGSLTAPGVPPECRRGCSLLRDPQGNARPE